MTYSLPLIREPAGRSTAPWQLLPRHVATPRWMPGRTPCGAGGAVWANAGRENANSRTASSAAPLHRAGFAITPSLAPNVLYKAKRDATKIQPSGARQSGNPPGKRAVLQLSRAYTSVLRSIDSAARIYRIVGITYSAPERMPGGQRAVTVLTRV